MKRDVKCFVKYFYISFYDLEEEIVNQKRFRLRYVKNYNDVINLYNNDLQIRSSLGCSGVINLCNDVFVLFFFDVIYFYM